MVLIRLSFLWEDTIVEAIFALSLLPHLLLLSPKGLRLKPSRVESYMEDLGEGMAGLSHTLPSTSMPLSWPLTFSVHQQSAVLTSIIRGLPLVYGLSLDAGVARRRRSCELILVISDMQRSTGTLSRAM